MLSYPRIFISAGEHSGDQCGAALAAALRKLAPDVRLVGVGGPRMAAAGVRLLADTTAHAGMGLTHTLGNAARWVVVYRRCIGEFNRERPDVFVPVDNPAFNLRLALRAQERRIPVCYYVSPQVWAWLPHRIHRVARRVTRMMTVLPFEKPLYDRLGVDCRYVGHPMLDYLAERRLDDAARREWHMRLAPQGGMVFGLLPGSRDQEVRHTFPIIAAAARIIGERIPSARFIVATASQDHLADIRRILSSCDLDASVYVGITPEVIQVARLCMVVSGTATLETAYLGTPLVIVYRTSALFRHAARLFLRVRHIGLVNILAGREVAPEFLKFDDDPRPVADAAFRLATEEASWQACRRALGEVIASLGPPGSSLRAAEAVLECAG